MSQYAGEYDEDDMRGARRRAAESQRSYDEEQAREYHRKFPRPPRSGTGLDASWRFTALYSGNKQLTGWRVELAGKLAGMIVIRGADLVVLSAGDERDYDSPSAEDIMAAYMKGPGSER
jgi:hypothetical protein